MEKVGLEAVFETGGFLSGLGIFQAGVNAATGTVLSAQGGIGALGGVASVAFGAMGAAALAGTALVVAGVGAAAAGTTALAVASTKTAISVEDAWTSVIKTTDGLIDEFGNLTEMGETVRNGFRELAQSVPVKLEDLLEIGALSAQLGIAEDQIVGFTETMVALGVSTNITSEEAAQSIAQIQNIFDISSSDMSKNASQFGSALVDLGNNFATTERDILSFAQRIAGAGKIAGLTEADILAIGAAMSSVGVEAEAGGTAVQKVLLDIQQAVVTGSDDLDIFAETAGVSSEEFAQAWQDNAGEAFNAFVQGLGNAGDDAINILQDLGLEDQRLIRSFLSLAGAGDLLTDSLDTSNKAFTENTALAEEAGRRYATTTSQFEIFKNTLRDIALVIGDKLLPILNSFVSQAIDGFKEFGPKIEAAITPAIDAVGRFIDKLAEGDVGQKLLPAIGDAISNFLDSAADADYSFLDTFADGLNNLAGSIADMIAAGPPDEILHIADSLGNVFDKIISSPAVPVILDSISSILSQLAEQSFDTFLGALDGFASFLDEHGDQIAGMADSVLNLVAGILLLQAALTPGQLEGFSSALGNVGIALTILANEVLVASGNIALLSASASISIGVMQGNVATGMAGMSASVSSNMAVITASVQSGFSGAVAIAFSFIGPATTAGAAFVGGMITGANSLIGVIAGVVAGGVGSALSAALGFVGAFEGAGAAFIQGAINGIESLVGALIGAAAGAAGAAAGAFAAAFQIGSPSKLAFQYSQFFMQGAILGFEDKIKELSGTASEAANAATQSFGAQLIGMVDQMLSPVGQTSLGSASGGTVINNTTNNYLNAHYTNPQSPVKLMDDLLMVQALQGAG